jgi:hypothetical protein
LDVLFEFDLEIDLTTSIDSIYYRTFEVHLAVMKVGDVKLKELVLYYSLVGNHNTIGTSCNSRMVIFLSVGGPAETSPRVGYT